MKKICKNVKTQKCKNYSTLCSSSKTSELRIALFKKTAKKSKRYLALLLHMDVRKWHALGSGKTKTSAEQKFLLGVIFLRKD